MESGRALREQLLGQSGNFSCEGVRGSQLIGRGGGPRVVVRARRGEVVGGVRGAWCTPEQRVLGREAITFFFLLSEKRAVSQQSANPAKPFSDFLSSFLTQHTLPPQSIMGGGSATEYFF